MNINFSTKPHVTISLSPVLEAFCRYYFKTPSNQKEIVVSRIKDLGKLIHANISSSEFPVKKGIKDHPVTFILPVNPNNKHALSFNFLKVTGWGEQKICDGIEYEYNRWTERCFEIGYRKGWPQKEIIEAILRGLNMRNNAVNFDSIKKNDYRNRVRREEKRFKLLVSSDY